MIRTRAGQYCPRCYRSGEELTFIDLDFLTEKGMCEACELKARRDNTEPTAPADTQLVTPYVPPFTDDDTGGTAA